ncbi:MAG: DUF4340 domain-containing protein [Anaerolineae bacterium]
MIRKSTWILLVIFAALVGLTIYLQKDKEATQELAATFPTASVKTLFSSEEGLPFRIRIEAQTGEAVEVVRNADNVWVLKTPIEAAADQSLAEGAASQITSLRVLSEVQLAPEIVGLNRPAYLLKISFTGGKEHEVEIGSVTPTESGYYVQVDHGQTVIVAKSGIDSLIGLLTSPPYAETPTPSVTPEPPTETPTPTAEAIATATP